MFDPQPQRDGDIWADPYPHMTDAVEKVADELGEPF
jgi:hypothetical protein